MSPTGTLTHPATSSRLVATSGSHKILFCMSVPVTVRRSVYRASLGRVREPVFACGTTGNQSLLHFCT